MHFNKIEGDMQCVIRDSDMHQVRWLALGGLSLVLLVLILVHFTFFGTLLIRFYRQKNITTHK
jgi:hypothetical protein